MSTIYKKYKKKKDKENGKLTVGRVIRRTLLSLFTIILLAVIAAFTLCMTVARGPSETVRNMLVLSAKQASATKWIPSLFLDEKTVDKIVKDSEKVTVDVMSAEEYAALHAQSTEKEAEDEKGEWDDAVNGVRLFTYSGTTYKAYVMMIKDPSRVFVGTSTDDYSSAERGIDIYGEVARYDAYAAINGGEFSDIGGNGTGDKPIGLTYSRGQCVWNQSAQRTFIGFDSNNRLIVREGMSYYEAESLGIRDAVMFQTGNVLISSNEGGEIYTYYEGSNTGAAQRTAIGQRADGTVIFIVTDGRTASSIGATHNDMIEMMISFGAVNAAMLDGGSSAMLYCENYFNDFEEFKDITLDEYQVRGLVNKYKAFTSPRTIPTYFVVAKEVGQNEN